MTKKTPKAVILGCAGTVLSEAEKAFFATHNPLGFILFARNCESPQQVKRLVADLKATLSHDTPLILIDQEGGRVARLRPPNWRATPAAGKFADKATADLSNHKTWSASRAAVYWNARMIAAELHALGINVNCAPLADVPSPDCHDIIGDRAYGKNPEQVSILAAEMARGLQDGGVLPVLKHIPGHGRARVDSHEDLPVVSASLEELRACDFVPFMRLKNIPLGMTAHILYTAIDDQQVATLSAKVMKLVRGEIGFDGLLMSDDLSMKALKGDFSALTKASLDAGCDLVLHCNGKMEEMQPIAESCRMLDEDGRRRLNAAWAKLADPEELDMDFAQSNVNGYLQAASA